MRQNYVLRSKYPELKKMYTYFYEKWIFTFSEANSACKDVSLIITVTSYCVQSRLKHQSSASLAFVRGLHRWPVNSPHKWPITRKIFPFDDLIMWYIDISLFVWSLVDSRHFQKWGGKAEVYRRTIFNAISFHVKWMIRLYMQVLTIVQEPKWGPGNVWEYKFLWLILNV